MLIFWFQVCNFLLLNIVIFLPLHIDKPRKILSKNFELSYRTWPSCATRLWDNFRSTWSNMCLPLAGYSNKVQYLCVEFILLSWVQIIFIYHYLFYFSFGSSEQVMLYFNVHSLLRLV